MQDHTASYTEFAARYRSDAAALLRALLLAARRAESEPVAPAELLASFRAALVTAGSGCSTALLRANLDLHALLTQPFAAYSEAQLDQALTDLQAGSLLDPAD